MAFSYPAPLPSLQTLFAATALAQGGYPAPIPSIGNVLGRATGGDFVWPLEGISVSAQIAPSVSDFALSAAAVAVTAVVGTAQQIIGPKVRETAVVTDSTVVLQVLLPNIDISDGSWISSLGGTDLRAAINDPITESTAQLDAEYIQSSVNANDTAEVKLALAGAPQNLAVVMIPYRIRAINGSANGTIELRCGPVETLIASWSHTNLPASFTTYWQTLTPAQAAAIADPSDLRLRFIANT